jgi:hypothetical protein
MEWRVVFRGPERSTALVQLCDERYILLIQVSAMKSACRHFRGFDIYSDLDFEEFPQKVKVVPRDFVRSRVLTNVLGSDRVQRYNQDGC